MPTQLILASTSRYRKTLLEKLGLPFACAAPEVDESPLLGESAETLVARLAYAKANAIANQRDQGLIIGSDQVCVCDGQILGKPGTVEKAVAQLMAARGRSITFYTGLCVLDAASGKAEQLVEPFTVHFRTLDETAIRRYVAAEMPLDCAGSFKCEGMGIVLFKGLEGRDPNALIGLPLIGLIELLERHGLALP
ncbi:MULTISPECIES: Maf family protein [Aeromonas]|uniref:Maf family protein n=1 Tax=Aeromonas TaxID=642 RepID=UPI000C1C1A04|nr:MULTISPECIES: nucleoside triphosphate pyrophosphatase [Aeromonas]ATU97890.1 septum formation inhibitor Maf [Aeromonas salmonicida]MDF2401338.1 septum formation inhibitor Maf [Aeromonas sp. 5HA1]MUG28342.1 septum formation inhibitor Maf [Aeromonas salmonicida]